jgi:hypothetical protein
MPLKERVKLYLLILVAGLILVLSLLVTGYDYTKARGFFLSDKREAKSLGESLAMLPNEYFWFAIAFVFIVLLVEMSVLVVKIIKNKFFK